jgi:hypothetical protein
MRRRMATQRPESCRQPEDTVLTLYIRYTIDMNKLAEFETYLKGLIAPVARCGGTPAGYFLPTKFAGPMNAAIGLTDFPDWASYGAFRDKMAVDAEGIEVRRRVDATGAILGEDRSFLSCVTGTRP